MRNALLDLTLALVITSNMIISCQSAATHFYKRTDVNPRRMNNILDAGAEYLKRPKRADLLRKWNIRPLQIQLDITIGGYSEVNHLMQELYFGAIGCGISGCHDFDNVFPKPRQHVANGIFNKRRRHLGKRIYQLLDAFHEGLQKIENSYGLMMRYENVTGYYNENREEVLQKLKTDIKLLNMEVEYAMAAKSSEVNRTRKDIEHYVFPFPSNQTDLIIQEWYVIEESRRFLVEWRQILGDLEDEAKKLRDVGKRRLRKPKNPKQKPRKKAKMHKRKGKS